MIVETKRLILRPFKKEDAHDVFEYLKNPTVNCFNDMKLNTLDEVKNELNKRQNDDKYYFAIVLKDSGKVIGEIFTCLEKDNPDTFSPCWMLNPLYQGKGYAYESAWAFFDYLFNDLNARRIYTYVEDYNLSSQHLCEKLNMRKEGLFKEFVSFINDDSGKPIYENTIQYAILKKEWNK